MSADSVRQMLSSRNCTDACSTGAALTFDLTSLSPYCALFKRFANAVGEGFADGITADATFSCEGDAGEFRARANSVDTLIRTHRALRGYNSLAPLFGEAFVLLPTNKAIRSARLILDDVFAATLLATGTLPGGSA